MSSDLVRSTILECEREKIGEFPKEILQYLDFDKGEVLFVDGGSVLLFFCMEFWKHPLVCILPDLLDFGGLSFDIVEFVMLVMESFHRVALRTYWTVPITCSIFVEEGPVSPGINDVFFRFLEKISVFYLEIVEIS